MKLSEIEVLIAAASSTAIAREVLSAYEELKRRYFAGDHRPNQLEAGRFSEAVFRVLQHQAKINVTPLGQSLPKVPKLLTDLENSGAPDPIRLTVPRVLWAVYEFRNNRDVAHPGGGVSASHMDSTFVTAACDWVMAELVRLFHSCSTEEAQKIVDGLVEHKAPLVVWFPGDGDRLVQYPDLRPKDEILLLLYHGTATTDDLDRWIPDAPRDQINARMSELVKGRLVRRLDRGKFEITPGGQRAAEVLLTGLLGI